MTKISAAIIFTGLLSVFPVGCLAESDIQLSEEFKDSEPRIQLYMAYAEFKMGHHELARQMWLNISGSGRSEALFNLANLYILGIGIDKDLQRGIDLYRESAESGSRAAAYQLGLIYLHTSGYQNRDQARHWLTIAALDGDTDAANLLVSLERDEPSNPMSEIEALLISGDSEQALKLLERLATASTPDYRAVTRLAWLYESGLAVERDTARASELFLQAAKAGNAEAQYAIAVMFQTGVGQPQDAQQAGMWLKRSAAQNYQPAKDKLSAGSAD